ncbi:hypothetical protein PRUPE_5G013500 [Prunus persica]|nr:hypothetical protein PRUPE_5G013500 [Prunus persica]
MYWQGYNGASLDMSDHPHHRIPLQSPSAVSQPLTMQNKAPENHASIAVGLATTSESPNPIISSSTPAFVHPNFSTSVPSVHFSSGLDMPTSMAAQSMPYPGSFSVGSDRGPLLTPPPSLLTPDQLAPSRSHILSSSQKLYLDGKDMGILMPTSSGSSSLIPPVTRAPLLPLPTSQQSPYSATPYTEEFDFLAMNEKFKKDEVWGYLGKEKQSDQTERVDNSGTGQCVDDKEGSGLIPNTKPAYNKDEFFDTISCNSLNRGGRNGHRFSERMRQDTETFGNFQQRYNLAYGGYGAGRGGNYRGPYQWGRGYGYGGRGRGGNMPF